MQSVCPLNSVVADFWFSALNRQDIKCLLYWDYPYRTRAVIFDLVRAGVKAASTGYKGKNRTKITRSIILPDRVPKSNRKNRSIFVNCVCRKDDFSYRSWESNMTARMSGPLKASTNYKWLYQEIRGHLQKVQFPNLKGGENLTWYRAM